MSTVLRAKRPITVAAAALCAAAITILVVLLVDPFGARAAEAGVPSGTPADLVMASNAITQGDVQQRLQNVSSPGALEFPPGVSYPQALVRIMRASVSDQALSDVQTAASLPDGVVVIDPPASSGKGIVVDLKAPFGYMPSVENRILGPVFVLPDGVSPADVTTPANGWPTQALLGIPVLPDCMVIASRAETPTPCQLGDDLLFDTSKEPGQPLS